MGNQIEVAGNDVISDHADAKLGSCGWCPCPSGSRPALPGHRRIRPQVSRLVRQRLRVDANVLTTSPPNMKSIRPIPRPQALQHFH
jgi:hypothetical protein